MKRTVLAIDPGTSKCGMALARRGAQGVDLIWRRIIATDELEAGLEEALAEAAFDLIVVGSGTSSRPLVERIKERLPSMGVLIVDEKDTTMQARERYWQANPRRGWRRLLPSTMQVPPEPVDDFVALILAERVLA